MSEYKFLIVEDDIATRELLRVQLSRNFDCDIKEAENGQIGLNILENFIPDIIFLDVSMPVMDGNEMLQIIKENAFWNKIHIVVLTALGDKNTVSSLISKGVNEYILKPIEFKTTINRVKQILKSNTRKTTAKSEKINEDYSNKNILFVEKEDNSTTPIRNSLQKQFVLLTAKTGSEALNIYTSHFPAIIFVNDNLALLDKKIITQRIPELADKRRIFFYLLTDPYKPLTSKVFNYDGVIKKNVDEKSLFEEMNKNFPSEQSSFEILKKAFEENLSVMQNSFKQVFEELAGYKVSLTERPEDEAIGNIFSIQFSYTAFSNVRLNCAIFATEKDIVSITNDMSNKNGQASLAANELFRTLAKGLSDELLRSLNGMGINLVKESESEINSGKKFNSGELNFELCYKTADNKIIRVALSVCDYVNDNPVVQSK